MRASFAVRPGVVAATAGARARPSASTARPGVGNLGGGCRLRRGPLLGRSFGTNRARCLSSAVELAQTAALHTEYWTKYAFMFPVSVCVATTAMLTGIGGAALFSPIFLIGFQALGPEFPLATPAEAFNVALITECFGFSSGLLGYTKRGLVDWRVSKQFIAVGLPFGCAGGLAVASADPDALRAAYGALTSVLGVYVLMGVDDDAADGSTSSASPSATRKEADDEDEDEDAFTSTHTMTLTAFDGTRYEYDAPLFDRVAVVATALGGLLTGLLSVGIGESVVPQLTRRGGGRAMPLPVAAGTSVSVVIAVALAAAAAQAFALYGGEGDATTAAFAFPKNLVCYTVPGVVCGGQIGPRLQGKIRQSVAERAVGVVFVGVGVAFLSAATRGGGG